MCGKGGAWAQAFSEWLQFVIQKKLPRDKINKFDKRRSPAAQVGVFKSLDGESCCGERLACASNLSMEIGISPIGRTLLLPFEKLGDG